MPSVDIVNGYLALRCSYQDREMAKEIRDAKWDSLHKVWLYPATKTKLNSIKKLFSPLQVSLQVEKFINEFEEKKEQALEIKQLKDIDLDCSFLKTKAHTFQKVGIAFMLHHERCMNFDELGLGKTLQSIAVAIIRKQRGEIKHTLVVCPTSMKFVWQQEIEKHSYEHSIVINGNKNKRLKLYDEFKNSDYLFLIVNYETLRVDLSIVKLLMELN